MQTTRAWCKPTCGHGRWAAYTLIGGICGLLVSSPGEAAWKASVQPDPLTRQSRCLMSSDPQTISDGYDTTPVSVVFNGDHLLVITQSELDTTFADLQLAVDKERPVGSDKLAHKKMSLVFDQDLPSLIQKLRTGKQLTISLRFWPTWPATQVFPAVFSLAGFSKAHDSLTQGCPPPVAPPSR